MNRIFVLTLVGILGVSTFACAGSPPASAPVAPGAIDGTMAHATHVIKTEVVEYKEGSTVLEGFLAYPTDVAATAKLPTIVVFHDWMGLGADTKMRAEQLARLGYVAFAGDIYGKGVRPQTVDEAGKLAGQYKNDRALMRARAQAALTYVSANPHANTAKAVALGYCFGGTAALELGRSGADLAGIVTFHGGLATPHPEDAKNIKGRVLALHGADDPYVKSDEVLAFEEEMRKAQIDWRLMAYGGAVHAFTVKGAGNDPSKGAAYNAKADARSWEDMRTFLNETIPQ